MKMKGKPMPKGKQPMERPMPRFPSAKKKASGTGKSAAMKRLAAGKMEF